MLFLLIKILSFEEGFWEPDKQLCTVCVCVGLRGEGVEVTII